MNNKIDSDTTLYPSDPEFVVKLNIDLNGKMSALVKFEDVGMITVDYEEFKQRFPKQLLDFYESRILFPFENDGTRKYVEQHKPKSINN